MSVSGWPAQPVEQLPQCQQIVHAECRSTLRDASECVHLNQICDVDGKGLQPAVTIIVGDPVLSPSQLPGDDLVLTAPQGMKRMSNAEPARGCTGMTCSC